MLEERRKDLLACLGFASLHDVDRTRGYGKLKATLLALQDDIAGAVEIDHPEMDAERRARWKLERELLPALEGFAIHWPTYLGRIALDCGCAVGRDAKGRPLLELGRLTGEQLRNFVMTAAKLVRSENHTKPF